MKSLLLAAIIGALGFTIGVVTAQTVTPTPDQQARCPYDRAACDVDGDGSISILDIADVAKYFGQSGIATPYPCVARQYFATPYALNIAGTMVSVNYGQIVPQGHPAYGNIVSGIPVNVPVCPVPIIGISTLTPTATATIAPTATATP